MTTTGTPRDAGSDMANPERPARTLRMVLLTCGILSSVLYAGMNVFIPMQWEGYSQAGQAISELSAIGAPTRRLWILWGIPWVLLVVAFGWGVRVSGRGRRSLRVAGTMLMAQGVVALTWPPMHLRGAEVTLTDTMHIVFAMVSLLLMLLAIGFSAAAFGKRFRVYTAMTVVVFLLGGIMTGLDSPRVAAGLPTPWLGAWERLTTLAYLVWVVVLATALLRAERRAGTTATSRAMRSRGSPPVVSAPVPRIEGHVSPGFEAVRAAFAENFTKRHELGGACCVYRRGEKIVDLWGGVRNEATGEPWERDTMVLVHSTTKGLAAMVMALAHSRGWLDYDERVATYWPEFAQNGKEATTVRQLLAHQAGLYALDQAVDRSVIADLDRLAVILARQKPAWPPGARQAYHGITLGYYENELIRRVDPLRRSLGQVFQDEIATPLGLDLYIRLPESVPDSRLATLARPSLAAIASGFPVRLAFAAFNPRSKINRALRGSELPRDPRRIYARNLEIPSGGGVGTARAIARAYSDFATGGHALHLRPETLDALRAPAIPSAHGFYDECMMGEVQFSLGFMKSSPELSFGSEGSYGSPGAGGSMGFADPALEIGYGYVTSRMGTTLTGDPRDIALRDAVYAAIRSAPEAMPAPEAELAHAGS